MARIVEQITFSNANVPKLIKVAAYARVSSGRDAMLHSLSAQVSYYSELMTSAPSWFTGITAAYSMWCMLKTFAGESTAATGKMKA